MTRRNRLGALCGLSGALLGTMVMSSVALAQPPGGSPGGPPPGYTGGPPPGYTGGPNGAAAGGASTEGTIDTSTTTTTTTTEIDGAAGGVGVEPMASEPLPNTGGAPLALSMLGTLLAGSAFMVRRKLN